jgi:hypothetical protein
MLPDEAMKHGRQLHIPGNVPSDLAHAVATILLLGIAGGNLWDCIYSYPPENVLAWVEGILQANDTSGLVHSDLRWWENQVLGH